MSRPLGASLQSMEKRQTNIEDAMYPLTLYDVMGQGTSITTRWLVEGILDVSTIRAALDRVVSNWPMLGGRLECTGKNRYHIRVPLRRVQEDYKRYVLTFTESALPLSHYVQLPLDPVTNVLPSSLFTHPNLLKRTIVRNMQHYQDKPLTFWHVTHFKHPGAEYSCVGVHFSHGLFDGLGLSFIVHALEAELSGRGWPVVPTPLHPGVNENPLQVLLDGAANGHKELQEDLVPKEEPEYGASVVGSWFCFVWLVWYLWQQYWHNRQCRMVVIPMKAYAKLVEDTRKALLDDDVTDTRLSTGDVLTAWLLKTIYSDHRTSPKALINLTSMASLRMDFDGALAQYPHNCFVPLPFPILSVAKINRTPLHQLAHQVATARTTVGRSDALRIYGLMKEADQSKNYAVFIPFDKRAGEHLTVSNISVARVVDVDWRGAGAGRVVCRYKYIFGRSEMASNVVTIAGRLDDGGLLLDVVLIERRMKRLKAELERLIRCSEA